MLKRPFQMFLVALAIICRASSLLSPVGAQAAGEVVPPPLPDTGVQIIVQPGEIPDYYKKIGKDKHKVELKKFKPYGDYQKGHVALPKDKITN